jgi:glycosyltransferase involved in cell wall biosynthesis
VIGVVTTSYPRSASDGAGGFVRQRVRALRRQGHAVEIVAAGDEMLADDEVTKRIPSHGLFYAGGAPDALEARQPGRRVQAWAKAMFFSWAMFCDLIGRKGRWQAVESHWLVPCGMLAAIALPDIPHRSHVHGGDLFLLRRLPWADSLARIFCRTRPELVFASAQLLAEFEKLVGTSPQSLGASCKVEAAPFDPSLFYPRAQDERQRLRRQLDFAGPTVLAVGRLVPIKGLDVLIAALAALPPPPRPELVIAGDGPERAALVGQAKSSGIRVRFVGDIAQSAVAEAMAAADLFVHPCRTLADGRSEGMPLVVREALACGARVIASACGGLGQLQGTPGLQLVPPDDVTALAAAIASALG